LYEGESMSEKDRRDFRTALETSDVRETLMNSGRKLRIAKEEFGGTPSQMRALGEGIFSRLLRRYVTDVAIQPVIDDENAASFVAAAIGSHDAGRAKIVVGDLVQIGIDLSVVPLDE